MSLSILNPLPSPQQQIESLQRELYQRNRQLAEAEDKIASLERALSENVNESARQSRAMYSLRESLNPLYLALQAIYGDLDSVGIPAVASGASPQKSAVWESWKQKLPSGEAKAIDALLLHGSLTTAQLRIHIGCATRTALNIASSLKSKGLVTKDNGKLSLKEL